MPYYFTYVADKEKYPEEVEWCDKIVMRHPDECTWNDLTDTYERFLRACGFVFNSHARFEMVDPTQEETENGRKVSAQVIQNLLKENQQLRDVIDSFENDV